MSVVGKMLCTGCGTGGAGTGSGCTVSGIKANAVEVDTVVLVAVAVTEEKKTILNTSPGNITRRMKCLTWRKYECRHLFYILLGRRIR